jgi:glycosyltransferase involved in cell wall biosynthesis
MKVLVFGHSLCAPRQIRFWRFFASLGHNVRVLAPRKWLFHEVKDYEEGNFSIKGVELFGNLRVRGLLDLVREFKPDILYSNEPTYSGGSLQAIQVGKELGVKVAIFEWDNVFHTSPVEQKVLENADLFIPGCEGAREVLKQKGVPKDKLSEPIPQVGVDTNLFRKMNVEKDYDLVYASGWTLNKGYDLIQEAAKDLNLKIVWLGAKRPFDIMPKPIEYGDVVGWVEYEKLPLYYNRAKLGIVASRNTNEWLEQFVYFIPECLSCEIPVVATDAGEVPRIWGSCKAVRIVRQNDVEALKEGIKEMLDYQGESGRKFVISNYGYEVAKKLVKILEYSICM